jgi:hypothetical protein
MALYPDWQAALRALTDAFTGNAAGSPALTPAPANAVFMDYPAVAVPFRTKVLALTVPAGGITFAAGNATAQLYVLDSAFGGASGATSQLPVGARLLGTAQVLGASPLAAGVKFWLSPQEIAWLQWYYPFLGVEIVFPAGGPTGGPLAIAVWQSGS